MSASARFESNKAATALSERPLHRLGTSGYITRKAEHSKPSTFMPIRFQGGARPCRVYFPETYAESRALEAQRSRAQPRSKRRSRPGEFAFHKTGYIKFTERAVSFQLRQPERKTEHLKPTAFPPPAGFQPAPLPEWVIFQVTSATTG
jgi:hypothetical protein